jgi:hypothetical protein
MIKEKFIKIVHDSGYEIGKYLMINQSKKQITALVLDKNNKFKYLSEDFGIVDSSDFVVIILSQFLYNSRIIS